MADEFVDIADEFVDISVSLDDIADEFVCMADEFVDIAVSLDDIADALFVTSLVTAYPDLLMGKKFPLTSEIPLMFFMEDQELVPRSNSIYLP